MNYINNARIYIIEQTTNLNTSTTYIINNDQNYYPVNKLRNIAIEGTQTEYIFLNDVDFLVCPHLDTKLMNYLENPDRLPGNINDTNRVLRNFI